MYERDMEDSEVQLSSLFYMPLCHHAYLCTLAGNIFFLFQPLHYLLEIQLTG